MTSSSIPSVPDLLAAAVRTDPARPLVTFYDDATGERVELSVVTTANWAAKTAGLLLDELEVERGDEVWIDLPTHWLTPPWLLAAWSVGAVVRSPALAPLPADGPAPAVLVCGPDTLAAHHQTYGAGPTMLVALSLRPLGGRFVDPLPDGVVDFAVAAPGQPDAFWTPDPPDPDDAAVVGPEGPRSQRDLAADADPSGSRVLTDLHPASPEGLRLLLGGLAHGGSAVWVRHPADDSWTARTDQERADRVERAQPTRS